MGFSENVLHNGIHQNGHHILAGKIMINHQIRRYPRKRTNPEPPNAIATRLVNKSEQVMYQACAACKVHGYFSQHLEQERGIYHSPDLFLTRRILPVVAKDIRLWVRQRTMSKWDLGDPGHRHHLPLFSPRSLWVPPWTPRQKIGEDED